MNERKTNMAQEISRREAIAGGAGFALLGSGAQAQSAAYDPTNRYAVKKVAGWTVLVNRSLEERRPLWADTLRLLEFQLFQIVRTIPAPALEKLRKVRIWAEVKEG